MQTEQPDPEALVAAIRGPSPSYKRQEMEALVARGAETAPLLVRYLDQLVQEPELAEEDNDFFGLCYALSALGHLRYEPAHDAIVRFARLPGDDLDLLVGETFVTDGLDVVLVRTAGARTDGLLTLLRDPEAHEYVRSQAADALSWMAHAGKADRKAVLEALAEVLLAPGSYPDDYLPGGILSAMMELKPVEYRDVIKTAFAQDRIDPSILGDLDTVLAQLEEVPWSHLEDRSRKIASDDVHRWMSWWHCFTPQYHHDMARLESIPLEKELQRVAATHAQKQNRAKKKAERKARKKQRRKK